MAFPHSGHGAVRLVGEHASQPQFGMRAEADKAQKVGTVLLIDQDEIRAKAAVSEIRPRAAQGVVVMVGGEWDVVGQGGHNGG